MKLTKDAAVIGDLQRRLHDETVRRQRAEQSLGGMKSVIVRLQATLQAERQARGEKPRRVKEVSPAS
jgi:hypothetical protein